MISGTSTFNMDFSDIAEEAYQRCGPGSELRSGWDLKSARRSLNLLTIEWAVKGINLWTIEEMIIPLVNGVFNYPIPVDTIDLLDFVIRTGTGQNQMDLSITRISETSYSSLPTKLSPGRPVQLWYNRQSGATTPTGVNAPSVNLWPVPNSAIYSLVYWRMRRMNDVVSGDNTMDIPWRFLPALISGLAYYLSAKVQGMDATRAAMLKADYMEQFDIASSDDREKASLYIVPRRMYV